MNTITETKNSNGTTTYYITGLINWWTTIEAEALAMVDLYNRTGSWEDRGTK